jgi:hypothetical protein
VLDATSILCHSHKTSRGLRGSAAISSSGANQPLST